jgi:hypothetical protein
LDVTVRALRRAGRLERVDEALIGLARTLADEIDDEHAEPGGSRYITATLAGRLAAVLEQLRGGPVAPTGEDSWDAAFARLSASLRDEQE